MPVFQYRALQGDGAIAEGRIEAGGRQEAFRQMEGRGLKPISLAEDRNGKPQKVEPNEKAQTIQKEMRFQALTAELCPEVWLGLPLCWLVLLLVFYIPLYQTIFAGFGRHRALIARVIVGISHHLRSYRPRNVLLGFLVRLVV